MFDCPACLEETSNTEQFPHGDLCEDCQRIDSRDGSREIVCVDCGDVAYHESAEDEDASGWEQAPTPAGMGPGDYGSLCPACVKRAHAPEDCAYSCGGRGCDGCRRESLAAAEDVAFFASRSLSL